MIKKARPDCKIVATEPETAQLLAGNDFKPHKIQGWTPNFVPEILDREIFDDLIPVTDEESIEVAKDLAKSEGIFTGISGGGSFAAALKVRPAPRRYGDEAYR